MDSRRVEPSLLAFRGVTSTYGEGEALVKALAGVYLDIAQGEFVAITGASGSGKSTAVSILGCLDLPTAGEYLIEGHPVQSLSPDVLAALRNAKFGFVSPSPAPLALGPGWERVLRSQMEQAYFQRLKAFLVAERARYPVYPKGSEILRAFQETAFEEVRVVILGQDPYHGPGQAHGLCFSVPVGVPPPPSLANVMVEIERDLGLPKSPNGDLTSWARQGVLLLNAVLTVRADQAASHHAQGWDRSTDAAVRAFAEERSGIVFLLWGRYGQQKEALIPMDRHYVLKAPHPSPLSPSPSSLQTCSCALSPSGHRKTSPSF